MGKKVLFTTDVDVQAIIDGYEEEFGEELEWDRAMDIANDYAKADLTNLIYSLPNCKGVMYGSLGRWDGDYMISKIEDIKTLIEDIVYDFDLVEITRENGEIQVRAADHDGCSNFIIKQLTDKGMEWYEKNYYELSDRELNRKIRETDGFVKNVKLTYEM